MNKVLKNGIVVLALAAVSVGGGVAGFSDLAFAKDGNGGGNGGGHGGGNGGGGGTDRDNLSNHGHSGKSRSTSANLGSGKERAKKDAGRQVSKVTPAEKAKPQASKLTGLNSLRRNFHAYLNTSDPRMTSLSAYMTAYAQYEKTNGMAPTATDPELGEAALRDALKDFAGAPVSDEAFGWAQDELGVGPAVGKIDQLRDHLDTQAAR